MSSSACSFSAATPAGAAPAARRASALPVLCLVLAGLLWGTGGLTGSLLGAAAGLSPLAVAALRLLAGGLLIVGTRLVPGRRWPSGRAAWARVTVTGLLAATFQSAYFSAVSLTSVSLATLVTIGATPVIVLAAELLLGRRRLDRSAATRTALALAGLGLLVGLPSGGYGTAAVLESAAMALLAAAGFATLTLISATPVPGLGAETVTGLGFTAGGALLLPLAALTGGLAFRPTLAALGWLAALATGPTAVAYTLYFRGLRGAPASTGALLSLLEPLTATVLSVAFLGNRLGPAGIAGAVLLAAAVLGTARPVTSGTEPSGRAGSQAGSRAGSRVPAGPRRPAGRSAPREPMG
jgi:drug/metabolite transporter, DME family